MLLTLFALLAGLALLTFGAEALVGGAVTLARKLAMPPLLIGITIVGFGTSLPELVVSVKAALANSPDIALGNVVGSNTANILLIGGLAALIAPIAARAEDYKRDLTVMIAASVILLGLGTWGGISRFSGAAIFVALITYLTWAAMTARDRNHEPDEGDIPGWRSNTGVAIALVVVGLAGLFLGANLLVGAAIDIARVFGLSEAVIGLTIVAVGTSLPELATSVAAAIRRHSDVALGNIVGSNIFNILGILGVTALIRPLPIAGSMARVDIPIMLAVAALLTLLIWSGSGIRRWSGVGLLVLYTAYIAWLL